MAEFKNTKTRNGSLIFLSFNLTEYIKKDVSIFEDRSKPHQAWQMWKTFWKKIINKLLQGF